MAFTSPNDITVTSWDDLNRELFRYSFRDDRFRSPYIFRGLSDKDWGLETSLTRLGHPVNRTSDLEPVILRSFKHYSYQNASVGDSVWNWLALAQHHGLPTRLLDWSTSPLAALHFVTTDPSEYKANGPYRTDGAIWCVDPARARDFMPPEVTDLIQKILFHDYAIIFNIDSLNQLARKDTFGETLTKFDSLASEPFPVFFYPPVLDNRIGNQAGMFSMMSSASALLSDWLLKYPDCFFRIIIPVNLKWDFRDRLDQMNLTERVMFPDLDGLSAWLKRYYSPRK
ncbi:MAG: FRG domain-containing protein [Chloroflexota bacterium]